MSVNSAATNKAKHDEEQILSNEELDKILKVLEEELEKRKVGER